MRFEPIDRTLGALDFQPPTCNESKLADGSPDGASLLWPGHFSRRESILCHLMASVR